MSSLTDPRDIIDALLVGMRRCDAASCVQMALWFDEGDEYNAPAVFCDQHMLNAAHPPLSLHDQDAIAAAEAYLAQPPPRGLRPASVYVAALRSMSRWLAQYLEVVKRVDQVAGVSRVKHIGHRIEYHEIDHTIIAALRAVARNNQHVDEHLAVARDLLTELEES